MCGNKRVIEYSVSSSNYRFDKNFQTDTMGEVLGIKNVQKQKSN